MRHEASTACLWEYLGAPLDEGSELPVFGIGTAIPFEIGSDFVVEVMGRYVAHAADVLQRPDREGLKALDELREHHGGRYHEVLSILDGLDTLVDLRRCMTFEEYVDLLDLKKAEIRVSEDPPTLHDFLKQKGYSEHLKKVTPKYPNQADYIGEDNRVKKVEWQKALDGHRVATREHLEREEKRKTENRKWKAELKNQHEKLCKTWNRTRFSKRFLGMPGSRFLTAAERTGKLSVDGFYERFKPEPASYAEFISLFREEIPFVDKFLFTPQDVPLRELDRRKHTYITGSSGSGKTELLKLLSVASMASEEPQSTIVVDPAGGFARQLAENADLIELACGGGGDSEGTEAGGGIEPPEVVYFDPVLGLERDLVPGLNPFDLEIGGGDEEDIYAQFLTDAFQEMLGEFTRNMQTVLHACLTVLLGRRGSTIEDLRDFMIDDENAELVALGREARNPAIGKFFSSQFSESHFAPTRAAISAKLQALLGNDCFRKVVTQRTTIPLRRAMEEGGVLILFAPAKGKLGPDVSAALGRLLIAMVKAYAFRRIDRPESERVPTHMIIDEFQNYVGASIETILTEARQYRLYLTLASQIVGQKMGGQLEDIALSCTNLKFVGKNSPKTHSKLAGEIGVPAGEMGELGVGDFFVNATQSPEIPPLKIHVNEDMLGDSQRAGRSALKAFYERQLERYYLPYDRETRRGSAGDPEVGESEVESDEGDVEAPEPKYKL